MKQIKTFSDFVEHVHDTRSISGKIVSADEARLGTIAAAGSLCDYIAGCESGAYDVNKFELSGTGYARNLLWHAEFLLETQGCSLKSAMSGYPDEIEKADEVVFLAARMSNFDKDTAATNCREVAFYALMMAEFLNSRGMLQQNCELMMAHLVALLHKHGVRLADVFAEE